MTDLSDVDVLLDELAADNLVSLLAAVAVQQGVVLFVDGRLLLLVPAPFQVCDNFLLRPLRATVFRIRIHLIRIRIQHFRLNTDPDPIRIQGFDKTKN